MIYSLFIIMILIALVSAMYEFSEQSTKDKIHNALTDARAFCIDLYKKIKNKS